MLPESRAEMAHPEVAGWMMGNLDPGEANSFRTHLESCPHCQAAVAEFAPVHRALLRLPPALEPPPALEERTLAAVLKAVAQDQEATQPHQRPTAHLAEVEERITSRLHDEDREATRPHDEDQEATQPHQEPAPHLTAIEDQEATQPHQQPAAGPHEPGAGAEAKIIRFPRWRGHVGLIAAAAVAAAAAIVAVVVIAVPTSKPAHGPVAAQIVLRSPSGGPASGHAVATHEAGGWSIRLTVHGLKPLSSGQFYECWYAGPKDRPGRRQLVTAGTFVVGHSGAGTFNMWSAADPHAFPTMEITAEHPGNARQHGKPILIGHVSL